MSGFACWTGVWPFRQHFTVTKLGLPHGNQRRARKTELTLLQYQGHCCRMFSLQELAPRIVCGHQFTKVDHFLTQVTVHLPPVPVCFPLQNRILLLQFHREKALKLPEVVEAIKAECDAMPMACNQWTIDVHDQVLSTIL